MAKASRGPKEKAGSVQAQSRHFNALCADWLTLLRLYRQVGPTLLVAVRFLQKEVGLRVQGVDSQYSAIQVIQPMGAVQVPRADVYPDARCFYEVPIDAICHRLQRWVDDAEPAFVPKVNSGLIANLYVGLQRGARSANMLDDSVFGLPRQVIVVIMTS